MSIFKLIFLALIASSVNAAETLLTNSKEISQLNGNWKYIDARCEKTGKLTLSFIRDTDLICSIDGLNRTCKYRVFENHNWGESNCQLIVKSVWVATEKSGDYQSQMMSSDVIQIKDFPIEQCELLKKAQAIRPKDEIIKLKIEKSRFVVSIKSPNPGLCDGGTINYSYKRIKSSEFEVVHRMDEEEYKAKRKKEKLEHEKKALAHFNSKYQLKKRIDLQYEPDFNEISALTNVIFSVYTVGKKTTIADIDKGFSELLLKYHDSPHVYTNYIRNLLGVHGEKNAQELWMRTKDKFANQISYQLLAEFFSKGKYELAATMALGDELLDLNHAIMDLKFDIKNKELKSTQPKK